MTYIRFEKPGENKVPGFILRDNGVPAREVRNKFTKHSSINYHYSEPMTCFGKYNKIHLDVVEFVEQIIDIPKKLFGKTPPKLINNFVNLWYLNHPEDQYDFRRRALLSILKAIIVLPLSIILSFLSLVVYIIVWLAGYKGLSHLPIIHPIEHPNTAIEIFEF